MFPGQLWAVHWHVSSFKVLISMRSAEATVNQKSLLSLHLRLFNQFSQN